MSSPWLTLCQKLASVYAKTGDLLAVTYGIYLCMLEYISWAVEVLLLHFMTQQLLPGNEIEIN